MSFTEMFPSACSRIAAYVWKGISTLLASCQREAFTMTVKVSVQILFHSICGRDAANTWVLPYVSSHVFWCQQDV